ncbi:hypothetical protein FVE85_1285 [Porphyridium purpureum]|uniref:Uncharacterized protein n=1 Tax=Porphyridium purpureum TaxID=35688 RepID=A0A5J4YHU3_PORPP|nr:hypothetical protein FVE85_1285 [Porphyridium purpureum]|eukprot:POR2823..scf251_18
MPVWPTLEQVGVCAASSSNEPDGTATVFWQSPSLLLVQIALQALKAVLTYGLAYIFGAQRLGKLLAAAVFLYPLWSPVGRAIKQNSAMRAYAYMALFVGTLTSVHLEPSKRYPDRVAIEIQDEDGHVLTTSIPGGQRMVSGLETGSQVCTVVMSDDESFARPAQISDLYFPFQNRFVGAYPYVNKNAIKRLQRKAEQGREP